LESEIHHCKKYVEINGALKAAYETAQKEILMLGELYRRQEEVLLSLEPNRYLAYEIEDLRLTFEDELKSKPKDDKRLSHCFWFGQNNLIIQLHMFEILSRYEKYSGDQIVSDRGCTWVYK